MLPFIATDITYPASVAITEAGGTIEPAGPKWAGSDLRITIPDELIAERDESSEPPDAWDSFDKYTLTTGKKLLVHSTPQVCMVSLIDE